MIIGVIKLREAQPLLTIFILFSCLLAGGCTETVHVNAGATAGVAGSIPGGKLRPALMRLEDIGPGGQYQDVESLQKLKVVAGYLHQEGIPFHISLIPRMTVPAKGYDVSIADRTPYAGEFRATIKYMERMGGIAGVHGYTHQSNGDASGLGFEFYHRVKNPAVPSSIQYARSRVSSSLDLFERAGITPAFWETPHYTASSKQCQAFEEQIGLIYEDNYHGASFVRQHTIDYPGRGYRGYTTVPTPLGYINTSRDMNKVIDLLDNSGGGLASFFYHPFKEFNYIHKSSNEKGETSYTYDADSPLHRLVNSFKEKGYTFVSIYSLAMFVPAQRLEGLSGGERRELLAGYFEPGERKEILVWDRDRRRCEMFRYNARWYAPRREKVFEGRGTWLEGWDPGNDAVAMAGDINGDRLDDLIFYSLSRGGFLLAENRQNKFKLLSRVIIPPGDAGDYRPLDGDFNGDGLDDLALVDRRGGRLGIALNMGEEFGGFAWQDIGLLKGKQLQKYIPGDFNGDGSTDVAVLDTQRGRWSMLLAADGTFDASAAPWLEQWGSGDSWLPIPEDVNGDGRCDIITHGSSGRWQVAVSTGESFIPRGEFGPWGGRVEPQAADLNGDKKSDLIIMSGSSLSGYNIDTALSVMD